MAKIKRRYNAPMDENPYRAEEGGKPSKNQGRRWRWLFLAAVTVLSIPCWLAILIDALRAIADLG